MNHPLPIPIEHLPKSFTLEPYLNEENLKHRFQLPNFKEDPTSHHIILAHYDDESILVYQAFSSEIADYAVQHQKFEGCPVYKLGRMTWIKPSFLWMQYRSGWNTKDDKQKRTLCIRLKRSFFDGLVNDAVKSSFNEEKEKKKDENENKNDHQVHDKKDGSHKNEIKTKQDWLEARKKSSVVVQWDPDYTPSLIPERINTNRRAIQLGLKGISSNRLAKGVLLEENVNHGDIISIEDITPFVNEIRGRLQDDMNKKGDDRFANIWVPIERPYFVNPNTRL
ncbi:unnamed protein product [Cunninghamella blakesleeana]